MSISWGTLQIPWLSSCCSARESTFVGDDTWGVLQSLVEAAALYKKQKSPPEA